MLIDRQPNEARISSRSHSSRRSNLGVEMQFGDVQRQYSNEQASKLWVEFLTDIGLLALMVVAVQSQLYTRKPQTCGIPINYWLNVFFALYGVRSLCNLLKIFVIRNFYTYVTAYDVLRMVLIDGAICCWIVYGNHLYYSKANNCMLLEDTQLQAEFMSCILIVGWLILGMYGIILFTIPCLYMYYRNQMNMNLAAGELSQSQIATVLGSLSRVTYDANRFQHENQCVICMMDYKEHDTVTQLRCDSRHYFHTECLENWVKQGKNQCPLCREPIQIFEIERDDHSGIDLN